MSRFINIVLAALAAADGAVMFGGCAWLSGLLEPDPQYGNRYEMDKQLADGILDDLKTGDRQSFKDRFSYYCLNYHTDFDKRAEEIFGTLEGSVISYTYDTGTDEASIHYGYGSRLLGFDMELETESGQYFIHITWYPVNDFDGNCEGITFLYAGTQGARNVLPENVIKPNGIETNDYEYMPFGLYPESYKEQIYRKRENTISGEYINAIYGAFSDGDRKKAADLFCQNARKNVADDIEKFFEYVPDKKYLEEPAYSIDPDGMTTYPSHTVQQYLFSAERGDVKEYYCCYADLEYGGYGLTLLYCLRDDTDAGNVGLNGVLFNPTDGHQYSTLDKEKILHLEYGIYVGNECVQFFE